MSCEWREDVSGDYWSAQCCQRLFTFDDGGPEESGMAFCCYCGAPLVAVDYIDQIEEEA